MGATMCFGGVDWQNVQDLLELAQAEERKSGNKMYKIFSYAEFEKYLHGCVSDNIFHNWQT